MEALDVRRKALQQLAARMFGTDARVPRYLSGQAKSATEMSELMALPQVVLAPIQNLDVSSTDFGSFYYMTDYDGLDSAPIQ